MRFSSLIRFAPTFEDLARHGIANPALPEVKSPWLISNRTQSPLGGVTHGAFDW